MKLDNKNIFCSVSAGYSSVMMAVMMPIWYPNHNIVYGMANTSKEREESLEFMNECDNYFNLNLVWVEAKVNMEMRKGTEYNIVNYKDLKRNGELFEDGIKKYGIPNQENKWCNRETKVVPLKKFCDDIFGKKNYSIAVGIRADEMDRITKDYKTNNVFYPLLDRGISKRDRNKFWDNQPIKIKIPAFKGNCDLCFEKSNRKLMTIMKDEPHLTKWWNKMIKTYGNIPLDGKHAYNELMERSQHGTQTFYRGYETIESLVKMAEQPFSKATDEYIYQNDLFDLEGDCGSGCQVF